MIEPSFQDMMQPKKIFIATGNTYPHRELFVSWAWHWDADRRAWIEDSGYTGNIGLQDIKELPDVIVKEEMR